MSAPTQQTSAFYDRMWRSWGSLEAASPAALHRRLWLLKLVRAHAGAAQAVLEVGCGLGTFLASLAEALPAASLSGADVSEASLAAARASCPRADYFALDLAAPNFEQEHAARAEAFDLIVCSEVLEHLEGDAAALHRMHALLTPGGYLIVSVPAGARTRFDRAIGHVRHYTESGLRELLTSTGYSVDTAFAWGFPFHSLYRTAVRVAARVTLPVEGSAFEPGGLLSLAYRAFGAALKPLYHLNQPFWGDQLFAVARKR